MKRTAQPPLIVGYVSLEDWKPISKAPVYLDEDGRVYCDELEFDARGIGPKRTVRQQYYTFVKRYLDERGLDYDISAIGVKDLDDIIFDMANKGQSCISLDELQGERERNQVARIGDYTMDLVNRKLPRLLAKRRASRARDKLKTRLNP